MNDHPILLVEDNPNDVELTLLAFKKVNIANDVVVAHDGVEALAHLLPTDGRTALKPSVVLLDLNLPRVDGLEVLRQLRADDRTRYLPVVVLTSSSEQQDLVASYDLGANSYVTKPVVFAEFVDAAANLGVYWLALNKVPDAAR